MVGCPWGGGGGAEFPEGPRGIGGDDTHAKEQGLSRRFRGARRRGVPGRRGVCVGVCVPASPVPPPALPAGRKGAERNGGAGPCFRRGGVSGGAQPACPAAAAAAAGPGGGAGRAPWARPAAGPRSACAAAGERGDSGRVLCVCGGGVCVVGLGGPLALRGEGGVPAGR